MASINQPLTNLQLELIKLFSLNLSDEQLMGIKQTLSAYFAERAANEMDRLWDEKKWSNETMDSWLADDRTDTQ